ncbi:hypothetical protein [Azoarcus sp. KH32C]|uniref:hypothetical protein n=1 Tax=Azoarcus sp. KH32C TaxID=748247 RepID=UPI00068889DF|nr:hypothetical protein [Azoarcus sp. KH32C]
MEYCNSLVRATRGLGLILGLLLNLTACAGIFGSANMNWQEEVLLHDGSRVIVERSVERGGPHEVGQRPSYIKETVSFTHPTTGEQIVWEDKATPDLRNSNFLPMALDIYQDKVYLVASPMGCLAYNKWGRPNPPYVVFSHQNKTWKRVPLQELPPETKALNLIFSSPDTEVENLGKRFVDAEAIRNINSGYKQNEYNSIIREPLRSEWCRQPTSFKAPIPIPPHDKSSKDR